MNTDNSSNNILDVLEMKNTKCRHSKYLIAISRTRGQHFIIKYVKVHSVYVGQTPIYHYFVSLIGNT
jgi:hypothetical protein